jgi:hypothetical protein
MCHRISVVNALALLLAAACSPTDQPPLDAGSHTEAGSDAQDGAVPDGEGGLDPEDVASPDATGPDGGDAAQDPTDGKPVPPDSSPHDSFGDPGPMSDAPPQGGGDAPDGRDGDAPPPVSCARTAERVSFTVQIPGGAIHSCANTPTDGGFPRTLHAVWSGVVLRTSTEAGPISTVMIDTCTSDSGCGAQIVTIQVETPAFFLIPFGSYVLVEYFIEQSFECTHFLRIANLSEWNGRKNPVSDVARTFLVVSDGYSNPGTKMAATGLTISPKALGCVVPDGGGCGSSLPVDNYALEFSVSGGPPILVPMGIVYDWFGYRVWNHRSYQSGLCDDYWNWAFTIWGQ